jgi:glucose/mannose-6-phosphate isomerase
MLMPVLGILNRIGLFATMDSDISEAIAVLNEIRKECDPSLPLRKNPARLLAQSLTEKLPVLYGEYNFTDVVALRWKQQLNENAKIHCYYEVFPELLHNEIEVRAADSGSDIGQSCTPIFLRDSAHEHDNQFEHQIEAAKHLVEMKGNKVFELWTKGKSELARLLSLSYIADFVSVYLAISRGVNPEFTSNIDSIKKHRLAHIEKR